MPLVPFKTADFRQLVDWIDSPELNYLWGGPAYDYPLTQEQIRQHTEQSAVSPFLFYHDLKLAGFVELFHQSSEVARVCRVFVDDKFRGQGVAQTMLYELIAMAKEMGYRQLDLCVFANNASAIRCYQALGFAEYQRDHKSREFSGEKWTLIFMKKTL
ncbi:putative acetyltransferase [Vibrio sinaloensis DSM 21326]|uniref:Putative acetyltransferase n=1 Tax=Vibrio sinaloensis DSM 21326 TaxID=945550 RepID=E8MAL6_PHOS4|nr:GNAT family N-acetyltransferase [Vibrio sinaloensis]EGA68937.1 putative acetyltransferase [Vibrio sinaloensis DSM 21326]